MGLADVIESFGDAGKAEGSFGVVGEGIHQHRVSDGHTAATANAALAGAAAITPIAGISGEEAPLASCQMVSA